MIQVQDIIENIVDAETANAAVSSIPALEHVLTSEKEARAMLKARTDELGLKYTKSGGYVPKEA